MRIRPLRDGAADVAEPLSDRETRSIENEIRRRGPAGIRIVRERQGANFIYAVTYQDMVKFGRATDVQARLSALQVGSPVELTLSAAIEEAPFIEQEIHRYLADDWVRGEWYRRSERTDEILGYIRDGNKVMLRIALDCVGRRR